MRNHNGWYQAIVESSADPKGQRRITAKVPDVLGTTVSNWARPVSIVDSPLTKGDMVWVNFPNGDTRYPTYTVPNNPKHGRIIPTKDFLAVDGPGAAGVTLTGDVHAKKSAGGYVAVYAIDFIETSDASQKSNIEPLSFDPVEAIRNAPAYQYRYAASGHTSAGPMRADLPEVTRQGEHHVSQGALIGILWGAVSRLADRVAHLETTLSALTENVPNNTLDDDND
ncbi:phage baseplate assembly protein V [Nonomuraea typhae]|uniref:Phage baseplate assembly protein V n=1 Tax=Nonomuraea typhae TaxID=2603600 RepID=A0ABW7YJ82_9ACTN